MKIPLLIILILSLSSCNKNMPYKVLPSATGSERLFSYVSHTEPSYSVIGMNTGVLNAAISAWNQVLGREFLIKQTGSFPIIVNWVERLSQSLPIENEDVIQALSFRYLTYCKIEMKLCGEESCYSETDVLIHELGHCIGFAHSENVKSIMYKKIDETKRITSEMVRIINQQ